MLRLLSTIDPFDPSHISAIVAKVREKDDVLYLEFYCSNQDCPARTIEVYVKDYDQELVKLLSRGPTCPVCHEGVKLHWCITNDTKAANDKREARQSVVSQMYVRDHDTRGDGLVLIPADVLLSDRLPDTPADFWPPRKPPA